MRQLEKRSIVLMPKRLVSIAVRHHPDRHVGNAIGPDGQAVERGACVEGRAVRRLHRPIEGSRSTSMPAALGVLEGERRAARAGIDEEAHARAVRLAVEVEMPIVGARDEKLALAAGLVTSTTRLGASSCMTGAASRSTGAR